MMGLWTLLLLHLHLAVCISLPEPSNVSISSFNMEHILSFSPGPRTPTDAHFQVQFYSFRTRRWKAVVGCEQLMAGQTCNLTDGLGDVFDQYMARVRAVRTNQTSNWTRSREFQPLADKALLRLQLTFPGFFSIFQFKMEVPYKQKTVISYLQPGVEYCVFASFRSFVNRSSISSELHCAFTSPPPPKHMLSLVLGLFGGFTLVVVLVVARVFFRSKVEKPYLPCMRSTSQPYICLMSSLTEED
ncbi:PREDICTED: interferon alpha/beta receptor 2-like [Cyprinodon variegatus]|uniref:interferon alpha/beta receptor 2-like n=1 Tax=Cyprinodon variegatus TaxID=28743 RepID=UPI000742C5E8|nr:PREDICTED: interferon alpha/beta receptor 2-like [Cyprinodon variegatus]